MLLGPAEHGPCRYPIAPCRYYGCKGTTSLGSFRSADMETRRKHGRLSSLLRRATTPAQKALPNQIDQSATEDDFGDTERTKDRYLKAVGFLQKALTRKLKGHLWKSLDFPQLNGEPENFDDAQFGKKINAVLEIQKISIKHQNTWENCQKAIRCIFEISCPFAKNLLSIADRAQLVTLTGISQLKVLVDVESIWSAL